MGQFRGAPKGAARAIAMYNAQAGYDRAVLLSGAEAARHRPVFGRGSFGAIFALAAYGAAFAAFRLALYAQHMWVVNILSIFAMPALLCVGFWLAAPYRDKHIGANLAVGSFLTIIPCYIGIGVFYILFNFGPLVFLATICGLIILFALHRFIFMNQHTGVKLADQATQTAHTGGSAGSLL
ncbi:MAG: hypothetical protein FWB71_06765 [Defluviitaleaceae bacterium]|nr:hypothetical protein [Defluviitaleaceae bacterium]